MTETRKDLSNLEQPKATAETRTNCRMCGGLNGECCTTKMSEDIGQETADVEAIMDDIDDMKYTSIAYKGEIRKILTKHLAPKPVDREIDIESLAEKIIDAMQTTLGQDYVVTLGDWIKQILEETLKSEPQEKVKGRFILNGVEQPQEEHKPIKYCGYDTTGTDGKHCKGKGTDIQATISKMETTEPQAPSPVQEVEIEKIIKGLVICECDNLWTLDFKAFNQGTDIEITDTLAKELLSLQTKIRGTEKKD